MMKIHRIAFLILVIFTAGISRMFAGISGTEEGHEHTEEDSFNVGEMIVDHITDAYEWHIMDIGKTHVSIPLPVILVYEGRVDIFMSGKFHHGHSSYRGYKIAQEGENEGKIVRVIPGTMKTDPDADLPLDLSITKNVAAIFVSIIILCLIFISIANRYKKRSNEAPKGLQSWLEPLIIFIRDDIAKASIGEKKYEKYVPYLLTLFFFIFLNNVLGLVPIFPGGANVTGNIAVTGVMALFTFFISTFSANKDYWRHIFNTPGVPWWLKFPVPLMPLVEVMGIFTKPFVLMVRLFANITAGHTIVLGFVSLIFIFGQRQAALGYGLSVFSVSFVVFMGLLELLVAFIQAYVFTLLSALYFGMATEEHH